MGGAVAGVQCWQCWPPDKWVLRRWMQQAGRQAIDTKHQATTGPTDTKHRPYICPQQSTTRVVSEVRLGPANVPAAEPPKVLKVHLESASLSDAFHLIENCVWNGSFQPFPHLFGNVLLRGPCHINVVTI